MIVMCTSKPHDGLLYYSYEYSRLLDVPLVIVPFPGYNEQQYLDAINTKYISCEEVYFNEIMDGPTLIMGRSMMTLPYLNWSGYDYDQKLVLQVNFEDVIAVYSENHPTEYPKAVDFFSANVYDLCDTEVYPNGVGKHFEKIISFDLYRKPEENIEFTHLFMGTNRQYYERIQEVINLYPNHGIITYDEDYIDPDLNNIIVPIDNLLGKFETYVYTKNTFDPAPRIIQECKWLGKDMIYKRDPALRDGGYVYWHRELKKPNIQPILEAYNDIIHGVG